MQALRSLPFPVLAVIAGAETGVELSDQLSFHLGLRTNGVAQSLARRNKYIMGETVRSAGVRAVKQASCRTVEEVVAFLRTLRTDAEKNEELVRCVVKPVQSAGTDDVFLCERESEALAAFARILGTVNGIGLLNEAVLVQEFLVGKEYVIDKVSRDGVHKIVAVWEYDKRKVNGANFVYFGNRLIRPASDPEMVRVLSAYADQVLDAVGIVNGPSHMEVMLKTTLRADGSRELDPCLVEVGARCQGGEGTWLPVALECVGYTQVNVTLDAYLDGMLFNSIEKDVYPMKKVSVGVCACLCVGGRVCHVCMSVSSNVFYLCIIFSRQAGRDVDLVARYGGIVRSFPGDALIRKLPSFRGISWEVAAGGYCHKTIDCFTRPGCVQLVADTEDEADRDFEAIHALEKEKDSLLEYAVLCAPPTTPGVIVMVDVDAELAAQIIQLGYRLVVVLVSPEESSASLTDDEERKSIEFLRHETLEKTVAALNALGDVLAIVAGANTGGALAAALLNRCTVVSEVEETLNRLDKNMP